MKCAGVTGVQVSLVCRCVDVYRFICVMSAQVSRCDRSVSMLLACVQVCVYICIYTRVCVCVCVCLTDVCMSTLCVGITGVQVCGGVQVCTYVRPAFICAGIRTVQVF